MAQASYIKKINIEVGANFECILGLNDATLARAGEILDDTEFCENQGYRSRIYGLRDTNISLSGDYEPENTAQQELFNAWENSEIVTIQYLPDGENGVQGDYVVENIDQSGTIDDKETIDVTLQGTGALIPITA